MKKLNLEVKYICSDKMPFMYNKLVLNLITALKYIIFFYKGINLAVSLSCLMIRVNKGQEKVCNIVPSNISILVKIQKIFLI